MTRPTVLLSLLLASGLAAADRVITVPTARKVAFRTVRFESRMEPRARGFRENLIATGLNELIEVELRTSWERDQVEIGTFDLAYNVVAAFPDLSAGISIGVQDAANRSADGRRFYLATTYRPVLTAIGGDIPADVTIGVFQGEYTHPFVGVSVPLAQEFRLLVEHNGLRPAAGFEIRPIKELGFRMQFRKQQTFFSLQWTTRF